MLIKNVKEKIKYCVIKTLLKVKIKRINFFIFTESVNFFKYNII